MDPIGSCADYLDHGNVLQSFVSFWIREQEQTAVIEKRLHIHLY